jgi:hypothetical protein
MSTGLFQRLFAAADGGLGSTRVRSQAAPGWAAEVPSIEAPTGEAPVPSGVAMRAETPEPACVMAAPSIRTRPGPAGSPPRLQPLDLSMPAAEAGQEAAAAARPERGATPPHSAAAIARAPAPRQVPVVPGAIQPPPTLHVPSLPSAQASEADERADAPPALLQPSRPTAAGATPPLHPAAAPLRPQPTPAAATPAAEPSVVHVSIGRVEFLPAAPPPARPRATPRATTRVPLADYLSGKSG